MQNKIPAIVSAILTVLLLVGLAAFSLFFEMVALNGVSEGQGMTVMGISLACQGIGVILMGFLAAWGTNLMVSRYNWNKMLAVARIRWLILSAISMLPRRPTRVFTRAQTSVRQPGNLYH